jgi:hypothetical protein
MGQSCDTSNFDPSYPNNPILGYYEKIAGFAPAAASYLTNLAGDSAGPNLGYGGDPTYFKYFVQTGGDPIQTLLLTMTEISQTPNYPLGGGMTSAQAICNAGNLMRTAGPANLTLLNQYLTTNPFDSFTIPDSLCQAMIKSGNMYSMPALGCASTPALLALINSQIDPSTGTPYTVSGGPSVPAATPVPSGVPAIGPILYQTVSAPAPVQAVGTPAPATLPTVSTDQVNQPAPAISTPSTSAIVPTTAVTPAASTDWLSSLTSSLTSGAPVATVGGISVTPLVLLIAGAAAYFLLKGD